MTKSDTELTTTLRPRLEEIVDLVHAMDHEDIGSYRHAAMTGNLTDEIRTLVSELLDTSVAGTLFPATEVRGTGLTYLEMAEDIAS